MATVHHIQQQHSAHGLATQHFAEQRSIMHEISSHGVKWTYVISNNLRMKAALPYTIQMNKPENATLVNWLEKVICGGECDLIYVEDLSVDDVLAQKLKQLCVFYGVTLVNVTTQHASDENVLRGPWN